MTKPKLLLVTGAVVVLVLFAAWYQITWNREVDGKSLREWHNLRVDAFDTLRRELRPIAEIAKGDRYFDAQTVAQQAQRMAEAASVLPGLFVAVAPAGGADDAIWAPGSDFSERLDQFLLKVNTLAQNPPQTQEAVRASVEELQQACQDCHRRYRD